MSQASVVNHVNHVPGPWEVHDQAVRCVDHGRYYVVARCHNALFTDEAILANARLIAAAPAMLEALKAALPLHQDNGYEQIAALIRAALAKAEVQP